MNKKNSFYFLIIFALGFFQTSYATSLSYTEQQIVDDIKQYKTEALLKLEKLVNINSDTANVLGVHAVGEMLRPEFEKLGFKTYWTKPPIQSSKAPSLIAEHAGDRGKKLLLIGHLDTVFPQNSPFQTYQQGATTVTGPGVIDDKGGIIVMLYALKALHAVGVLKHARIVIVLTGDEEAAGRPITISRKALVDIAKQSDFALEFEWSTGLDSAIVARRGITYWEMCAKGRASHSSQIFNASTGYGAIFELARILNTMQMALSDEKGLTFSPGMMLGGNTSTYDASTIQGAVSGKRNVVAKTAVATGDLRFLTESQRIQAEKKINDIVVQHLPGTIATITFNQAAPPMQATEMNGWLLKQYSDVSCDLGYGPVKPLSPALRGAADISYIASIVSGSLAGLGALGAHAHSVDETLDLKGLPIQTARAAILMYRLIQTTER